jgi:hypothetical protein
VRDGMGLLYSSMFGKVVGGLRFPIRGMQGSAALRGLGAERKIMRWHRSGVAMRVRVDVGRDVGDVDLRVVVVMS